MMPVPKKRSVRADDWAAYNRAFRDFSEKVRIFQRNAADPSVSRADIEAAVLAVEKARIAYSSARDAVAQQLLNSTFHEVPSAGLESSIAHTAEVAELLWESVGRPEGTAEADWYRAEEIIRAAQEELLEPAN